MPSVEQLIRGWKQIARRLGLSVRAAQRREADGLPVHRDPTVFVFEHELRDWMAHQDSMRPSSCE